MRRIEYHETDLNTTRRIWIPWDGFEYHEMDLYTTRRICIPWDGFKYHEANLNTMRRVCSLNKSASSFKQVCSPFITTRFSLSRLKVNKFKSHLLKASPCSTTFTGALSNSPHIYGQVLEIEWQFQDSSKIMWQHATCKCLWVAQNIFESWFHKL